MELRRYGEPEPWRDGRHAFTVDVEQQATGARYWAVVARCISCTWTSGPRSTPEDATHAGMTHAAGDSVSATGKRET